MDKMVEKYNALGAADRITVRAAYDFIDKQRKHGMVPRASIKKLLKMGYDQNLVEIAATLWGKCLCPWDGKIS